MKYFLFLIAIILYKSISNFFKWKKLAKYKKLYLEYLSYYRNNSFTKDESQVFNKFLEKKFQIIDLFKNAGLKNFSMTATILTGYNHVQSRDLDFFDNLTAIKTVGGIDIPNTVLNYFISGIGIYKTRTYEAFSLLYWLNCFIFMPKSVIAYLGYPLESKKINLIKNVLNIIWWFFISFLSIFHVKIPLIY